MDTIITLRFKQNQDQESVIIVDLSENDPVGRQSINTRGGHASQFHLITYKNFSIACVCTCVGAFYSLFVFSIYIYSLLFKFALINIFYWFVNNFFFKPKSDILKENRQTLYHNTKSRAFLVS